MIKDLQSYFEPQYTFYLDSISYKNIEDIPAQGNAVINCTDNITTALSEDMRTLKLQLTRSLDFSPRQQFSLSVVYIAILTFDESKAADIDWKSVNLAEEFKANGSFVTLNLMSRICMLIGDITSAQGQMPIVLPSTVGIGSNK